MGATDPTPRTCRECGCTEREPCLLPAFGTDHVQETCSWAEEDLCTACTPDAAEGWVHPAEQAEMRGDQRLWQLGDDATVVITDEKLAALPDSPLSAVRRRLHEESDAEQQPQYSDQLLAAVMLQQAAAIEELTGRVDRLEAKKKG